MTFYKGHKHSEETKKKLSLAHIGKKASDEHRRSLSLSHRGKRPWAVGKTRSEETKKKMSIAWETRPPMSIESRKKMSETKKLKAKKGLYPYQGGVTKLNEKIRKSFEYKLWRQEVFKRDNWTCLWCKARSGIGTKLVIHADHIKPFALFPELRFETSNGRTLCVPCHKKTGTYGRPKKYLDQLEE